jgi:pimeloyl-ACP methyl ester carboxylesterase
MPIAAVNNQHIYYETRGDRVKPPLLIISGITDYIAKSEWQVSELAFDFFVILFDNRGAGRSSSPVPGYTIADMADDTAALLGALDVEPAAVFGFSMGGMIALELALRHARRVRRLALGCTTAGGPSLVQPDEWSMRALTTPARSGDPRQDYLDRAWLSLGDQYRAGHPEGIEHLADIAAANPQTPQGYAGQFQAVLGHDVTSRLGNIHIPTLILHGGADRIIPVENGRILADCIPGARLVIYPNAGHLFFIEEAAAVNEEIRRFCLV